MHTLPRRVGQRANRPCWRLAPIPADGPAPYATFSPQGDSLRKFYSSLLVQRPDSLMVRPLTLGSTSAGCSGPAGATLQRGTEAAAPPPGACPRCGPSAPCFGACASSGGDAFSSCTTTSIVPDLDVPRVPRVSQAAQWLMECGLLDEKEIPKAQKRIADAKCARPSASFRRMSFCLDACRAGWV